MTEKVPMLKAGYEAMVVELKQLKSVDRQAVVKAIEVAREHGDLSENAEYHAAKEQQGFIEARINELEGKTSRAQVIDPATLSGDRVVFGATVKLIDEDDVEVIYQLVGADEGDVKLGKISFTSPLGRALISRKIGDDVEVKTPGGSRYYEIETVEFI